jgi:hypothetical protein
VPPDQLQRVDEVTGWSLDASAKAEIDRILRETIADPSARNSWPRRHAASQRDATANNREFNSPPPSRRYLQGAAAVLQRHPIIATGLGGENFQWI